VVSVKVDLRSSVIYSSVWHYTTLLGVLSSRTGMRMFDSWSFFGTEFKSVFRSSLARQFFEKYVWNNCIFLAYNCLGKSLTWQWKPENWFRFGVENISKIHIFSSQLSLGCCVEFHHKFSFLFFFKDFELGLKKYLVCSSALSSSQICSLPQSDLIC